MVSIAVVYIPASKRAIHLQLTLGVGTPVAEALQQSGLTELHPEIKAMPTGIFGSRVPLTTILKEGDRVEIYRPLLIDPKEKRRQRARPI